MPGKVKVKILAGRNLPVMDRSSDTTDAYVEVKLGNTTYKTDVCRKSLNPQWNTEWYRFEVDDSELQDEPLQIRLMDHDTYSANDAIGKVYVDLNPLLLPVAAPVNVSRSTDGPASSTSLSGGNVMSGWIPVFDTMHGIRGEVNVIVKVELFSDFNKFRQSSCGVQFFCSGSIPHGYHAQVIHGFVEELVCNDDPEYQWIDKIRTPRASNEARQTLFLKLSGEVQRKIGLKALDLGGNAVIGYQQCFDLEGESGIVVRGIGTAVSLLKLQEAMSPPINSLLAEELCVIPPSRNPSLSLSPDEAKNWAGLSPTRMGSRFPGLGKTKPKKKKKRSLTVVPPYLAAGSTGGRHNSQPAGSLAYVGYKAVGRSTQSLAAAASSEEAQALHDYIELDTPPRPGRFSRGLRAMGLSKKITALRAKFHSDAGEEGTESPDSSSSETSLRSSDARPKKASRFRFARRHKRANSDSMAATLVLSLMKSSNLSRVVEVRESPGSSPTSPPQSSEDVFLPDSRHAFPTLTLGQASSSEDYLRVPRKEEEPDLKYVDGHLVSNTSSGVSSSSDSSSSEEEEASEEYVTPGPPPSPFDKSAQAFTYENIAGRKVKLPFTDASGELRVTIPKTRSDVVHREGSVPNGGCDTVASHVDRLLQVTETRTRMSETAKYAEAVIVLTEASTETESRATSESVESPPPSPLHATTPPRPILPSKSDPLRCDVDCTTTPRSFTRALNAAPVSSSCRSSNPDVFVFESNVANSCTPLDNPHDANRSHPQSADNFSTAPSNGRLPDGLLPGTCVLLDDLDVITPCPLNNAALDGGPSSLPVSGVVLDVMCKSSLVVPMSPIHKSKSASALSVVPHGTNGDPSDRHGPCLIPPDRQEEAPPTTDEESALPSPANKVALIPAIHRRSSDSDLSVTPKGNSLVCSGSERLPMGNQLRPGPSIVRPAMNQENLDMLEYPFLTMTKYPPGFILHLGGTVSSRSVKLLERITNLEEPQSRDTWWTELRMEVRSHARALGCNVVLGYSELTSICEDVCVLSASGTAAMINLQYGGPPTDSATAHSALRVHLGLQHKELMTASLDRTDFERDKGKTAEGTVPPTAGTKGVRPPPPDIAEIEALPCAVCHIPYSESSVPYQVTMTKCQVCRRGKVPDVLLTTIELPDQLPITGKGCVVQAYTVKAKRDGHGELNAIEISDGLPFLEYELHRLLVNKLKVKGMNAIFRLKVQVAIGEKLLVGHATGTAVLLAPLPLPPVPNVSAGKSWTDEPGLAEMQRLIQDEVKTNRELYQLGGRQADEAAAVATRHSDTDEDSEDEMPDLDLSAGNKDTCVLEVDDLEDVEVVGLLIDPPPPEGFHVVTTETVPGLDDLEVVRNLQMFTQIWRAKILVSQNQQGQCQNPQTGTYSPHFQGMLQSVCFKLRRMAPCALCDLRFQVQLEADELQLSVYGMALGLGEPEKPNKFRKRLLTPCRESLKKSEDDDTMFNLDDEPPSESVAASKNRPYSPLKMCSNANPHHISPSERYGVDLTPLSYVPGGKIERYLGNLNFFFIRESTSIKESGGLSGFVHSFVTEVLAIVRAHVTALGGNAMVSYFISECILYDNQHKNQGQCLLNVGGDVVFVSYRG